MQQHIGHCPGAKESSSSRWQEGAVKGGRQRVSPGVIEDVRLGVRLLVILLGH